jgi:hypothetical protein
VISSSAVEIARATWFPWAVAAVGIAAALAAFPFVSELPIYLDLARNLAAGLRVPTDTPLTWPVGYPLVLAPLVGIAEEAGVTALQAAAYAVSVWLVWDMLRARRCTPWAIAAATLLLAFHPYMLLNISRVNEAALTVPLALVLCRWLLDDGGDDLAAAAALGVALGFFVLLRPNAIVLLLLPMLAGRGVAWVATCVAAAIIVHLAGAAIATGDPFYFPGNGPYNLAAGNNPFSREALIASQNAEQSLLKALPAYGVATDRLTLVPPETYWRIAIDFILADPLEALRLVGLKAMVLFGPRLANADNRFETAVQWLLIFPPWLFAAAAIYRHRLDRRFWLFLAFGALFVAPFLATNADPRFRLPLDAACIAVAIFWIDATRRRRT